MATQTQQAEALNKGNPVVNFIIRALFVLVLIGMLVVFATYGVLASNK